MHTHTCTHINILFLIHQHACCLRLISYSPAAVRFPPKTAPQSPAASASLHAISPSSILLGLPAKSHMPITVSEISHNFFSTFSRADQGFLNMRLVDSTSGEALIQQSDTYYMYQTFICSMKGLSGERE